MAQLSNYQTYALYALGQIQSLDAMDVPGDTRQLAEATFLKKRMYYNMRIKSLRQACKSLVRMAREGLDRRTKRLRASLAAVKDEAR